MLRASEVLKQIGEMKADEVDALLRAWHSGMWNEWDAPLLVEDAFGFGGGEWRIAAKTGSLIAAHSESTSGPGWPD